MNGIPNIIPDKFRRFLVIAHYDLPPEFNSIPFAIKKALETIEPNIRINKKYKIFVGKFPFKVPVPPDNGYFIFSASEKPDEYVCAVYDDYIFFDYAQLSNYPSPIQVAHILEEFVHALMNVADEAFAKNIVCHLLRPHIVLDEQGRYVLAPLHNASVHQGVIPSSLENDKDKKKKLRNKSED